MISFGPTWTLTPNIRRSNNHQEVEYHEEGSENGGRNVGKIWGHVAVEGEFENGAEAPGAPGKGPKKILKKFF